MGFLNTDSMPRLVEKLADGDNIKITGNSKGNRVGTVVKRIVEKADDVTKAIQQEVVNNARSFKVGTGNVDVSSDVEDGFGEVGIKGVTYQNIAYKNEHIPSNCSYSKETGEGVVNYNAPHLNGFNFSKDLLKPNTLYTVIINIKENSLVTTSGRSLKLQMAENNTAIYIANGFVGQFKVTISTKETIDSVFGVVVTTSGATEGRVVFDGYMVLEGDHTNNPNLPSYFKDIVGVGDKSKNLFNIKDFVEFAKDTTESPFYYPITLEANTQYTFSDSTGMWNGCGFFLELLTDEKEKLFNLIDSNFANRNKFTFTTNAKTQYLLKLYKHNVDKMLSLSTNFQLEKGSTATTYEPYYDGHKIEILSHGKNLLYDTLDAIPSYLGNANDLDVYSVINGKHYYGATGQDYRNTHGSPMLSCKPNTTYSISLENPCRIEVGNPITVKKITDTNDFKTHLTFTTESNQHYMSLKIWRSDYINTEKKYLIGDIQIEESPTPTSYEPYTEDKTQILLDEPLMRLPNGVCDEIFRDRKLIRRVGKVVLDGSEDWKTTINLDGLTYRYSLDFKFKTSDNYNNVDNIICNDLATKNFSNIYNNGEKGITTWWSNDYIKKTIVICLSNNYSLEQFKEWLSQNPITVYYELETPIITELPAPYLRIFKDGHLTFNTLVAPESNHVVQLNKSAQIERSIREVQGLDSRVGQLESFYDDMILETSHKLNLLTYDFEYTKESEDI